MPNLSDREWKSFGIGDLFIVTGTTTTHPSILKTGGDTPRITCQAVSNGLEGFYANEPTEQGGVLTVDSATNGAVNYQGYDFIATDHVEKIMRKDGKKISRLLGTFLVCAVRSAIGNKYNYGYKFAQDRIRRQTILLPVDDNGAPDFDFMEEYVRQLELERRAQYKQFAEQQLAQITKRERVENEPEWQAFYISDIFDIQRGKRLKNGDHIPGNMPYVSSSAENNGIDDYVGNTERVRVFNDCLTLANSGSVGSTFYHQYSFVASDHVTSLKKDGLDKYAYIYISTIISRLGEKYNFNREINDPRIKREQIMLPSKNGEPDFEYMSNYAKSLMAEKYEKYIAYASSLAV